MDNFTHSAVGALFTETLYQQLPEKVKESPHLRRNLHIVSFIASNCPDFDLLLNLIDPTNLGYLINHRGHTHTFIGLLLQFLTLFGLSLFLSKKIDKKILSLTISFGLFSHLGLDFMNSYGVHPLWPFNNNWYYGDFVFIIEPFLWITASISLFFIIEKGLFRYFLVTTSLLTPVLAYSINMLTPLTLSLIYIFSLLLFLHLKPKTLGKIAATSLCIIFSFICLFMIQNKNVESNISSDTKDSLSKRFKELRLLDVSATPFPGDFLCWSFLTSYESNGKVLTLSGTYSVLSHRKTHCPLTGKKEGVAPDQKILNSTHIKYSGLFINSTENLKKTYSLNCKTKAWFTYARFPYIKNNILSDLRFAQRRKHSFASLNLDDSHSPCPVINSPWTPPRKDILFTN